jgi:hypothetical protein
MKDPDLEQELRELESRLLGLKKGPSRDERFYQGLERGVRRAVTEPTADARWRWALALVSALPLLAVLALTLLRGAPHKELGPTADEESVLADEESELDEVIDQMDAAELRRAALAFEGGH